jgi:hypothetical protein
MVFGFKKSKIDGTESIFGAPLKKSLPQIFSLKNYLPKVMDQGTNPTCVPCSLSTNINWNLNLRHGDNKIDNKVKIFEIFEPYGDENGMTFKDAFSFLRKKGVTTEQGNFKIERYAMVRSALALKYAIYVNGPCVGALPVYNTSIDRFWDKSKGEYLGGHAIAIIGWDEEGFIIRNSWGTSYGEKGYAMIPYKEINKFFEIWTIIE